MSIDKHLKNSNLIFDFGYTDGYKKTSSNKLKGKKNHFFSKFVKNFYNFENNSEGTLLITNQDSNNDKYFKLYSINSELISDEIETLENSIDFSYSNDEIFLVLMLVCMKL